MISEGIKSTMVQNGQTQCQKFSSPPCLLHQYHHRQQQSCCSYKVFLFIPEIEHLTKMFILMISEGIKRVQWYKMVKLCVKNFVPLHLSYTNTITANKNLVVLIMFTCLTLWDWAPDKNIYINNLWEYKKSTMAQNGQALCQKFSSPPSLLKQYHHRQQRFLLFLYSLLVIPLR